MKTYTRVLIMSLLFCLLLLPYSVEASSEPTKNFYSQIEVQEDGSIKVREFIELEGDYHGLLRDIAYQNVTAQTFTGQNADLAGSTLYNGSNIRDVKVGSIAATEVDFSSFSKPISYFEEVTSASNGTQHVFTKQLTAEGVSLKVFNPSSTGEIFYLEYRIDDAVVVHDDVAELAWNVLGEGYQENIANFQVKVILPQEDSDLRVFLHGPLNGEIERLSKGALASYRFLGAYNAVSVRLVFAKEMVPYATKHSNMQAKSAILEIEQKLAEEANAKREAIKRQNNMVIIGSIVWFVIALGLTIYFCYLSRKSKKTTFTMQYYRDFPGEYGPEVLQYLLDKKVDEQALSAVILNLVYKKVLKVETISEKKKEDYKLVLEAYDENSLSVTEKQVVQMLIEEVGNGKEVVLSSLKKYCANVTHAESFMSSYHSFVSDSKEAAKKEGFYGRSPLLFSIAMIICFLGMVITILALGLEVGNLFSQSAAIFGIIFVIILMTRRFYTPKGALHLAQWQAHKRFLEDFGRLDEKELPEVTLWDKYLVYATVLGCADTLAKEMKLKVEMMEQSGVLVAGYDPFFSSYLLHASIYRSINHSVHNAVASSRSSIAASQASSGSGFGGGASGGGGSFGGGGGGGRF